MRPQNLKLEPFTKTMPCLLAPGGSLNSAIKALEEGADALYIGLKGHSRGGSKGELEEKELALCLEKVKAAGKKLYLAFNLIPEAQESKGLLNKIEYYFSRGIAGVILNEPSLIQQVARKFPSLNITASIGCAIGNLQEALFYRDLGATTLVLGPQVDLKNIAPIKAQVDCRIEVFVYGFQEMFTLGKCWLGGYVKQGNVARQKISDCGMRIADWKSKSLLNSKIQNPQSAIRRRGSPKKTGVCGQVCGLITGAGLKPAPTMAPQAFYVLHSLKDLMEAGVDVFKLGGRYFKPQSIPPVVNFYRRLLDHISDKQKEFSREPWEAEAKNLFHPPSVELIYK